MEELNLSFFGFTSCKSYFCTMILRSLSLLNYKNISSADLSFSPMVNCFVGDNGMGKTNLLDAIYYLSFAKAHAALLMSLTSNMENKHLCCKDFMTMILEARIRLL